MDTAWKSRTIWLNLVALVLAVLTLPQFNAVVPPDWLPMIGSVVASLNIVLRFFGGNPLTLGKGTNG